MSDPLDDPSARVFRRALTGLGSSRPHQDAGHELLAPGRGRLEVSIALSACAILEPLCAVGAVVLALGARAAGNRRWGAALLAGLWCGLLGTVLRVALGAQVVP